MPLNVRRLGNWMAAAAVVVVLVVAGFYLYARYRVSRAVKDIPRQLGVDVEQSTRGFRYSKSEGGRTLFSIRASQAVRYAAGGRAQLKDVNIVVYGRQSNRYDQIYGADFQYDPQSGDISAQGEVDIDLEANGAGAVSPDQAPPEESKNPIHLKTSGLVFNQETGLAATTQSIEFRLPQASGSAQGATYDSKAAVLTLESAVRVRTAGPSTPTRTKPVRAPTPPRPKPGPEPAGAALSARRATISRDPRQAVLEAVQAEQGSRRLAAERLTIVFGDDNRADKVLAEGEVRADDQGETPARVRARRAEIFMNPQGTARTAALSGGVEVESGGKPVLGGSAGHVLLEFAGDNRLAKAHAADRVHLRQGSAEGTPARASPAVELAADAMDFLVRGGRWLERGVTSGKAQITLGAMRPGSSTGERTVVTAERFEAAFAGNRLRRLRGAPGAKVVASTPGEPERVSTSRELDAVFTSQGNLAAITQAGDVRLEQGQRQATAQQARYSAADDSLLLTGSPRVTEGSATTTADTIRLRRPSAGPRTRPGTAGWGDSSEAAAEGEVKTTYSELQAQPAGALLAGAEPIHVTAASMAASAAMGVARYRGDARLWQGANIVQAPLLDFDRRMRTLLAAGNARTPVTCVFIQADKNGKVTPVSVTAARLNYQDDQRRARFSGGVRVRGAEVAITAASLEVRLYAKGQQTRSGASQVQQVIAEGHVLIQEPTRRATGNRLVYTAEDGKFVLTGGPPSIFDAEHGSVTGDSLTFFSHDDRVRVASRESSSTVTQTQVKAHE